MHILTVAYGVPQDAAAFDEHYRTVHEPLARAVPGLRTFTARRCAPAGPGPAPYHLLVQLAFDSAEDLGAGLASPAGQAAAADVASFADGGATLFVQYDD